MSQVSLAYLGTLPCPITWKTSSFACCALSHPEKGESQVTCFTSNVK